MRRTYWWLALAALLVLLGGNWGAVQAGPPSPQIPPNPVIPPQPALAMLEGTPDSITQVVGLPSLKAVLVVGPLDSDGTLTSQEQANMELAAKELEAQGVTVHRFYTPNNDWNEIKKAAQGAHFFLYRGHGVYQPPMPHPTVGGFSLNGRFILPSTIREDLDLAPGAIVMLYGCFTAGTSVLDEGSISSEEARRRVGEYASPFFDVGAAGYYANWWGDAFQKLVRYLFQGMTLGQAYEAFYDFNHETVGRYAYADGRDLSMWLDRDYWWEEWQYNYAFVGQPNQTLLSLFGFPEMKLEPAEIVHIADTNSPPQTFTLSVRNEGPGSFSWTAEVPSKARWLDAHTLSGQSGQDFTIVLDPSGKKPGDYQIDVRILANDPTVTRGDQVITVTLHVKEELHSTYLPAIYGSAP